MTLTAPAPRPEPKRDRWGRPIVLTPDGKRTGYVRVTTIAKTLEDEGSLANWKMRQVAVGLAKRPDLLALASTAAGDKGRLDKITQQALDAAASDARANLGTALHSIIEMINLGLPFDDMVLPDLRADVDAYRSTMAMLTVDRAETFVVNDRHQYGGTFDFILTHPGTGRWVIADLKTGADLSYSWRSIAVQLAAYAHAEAIYDPATDERTPMPDIDRTVGIIVHLPASEGRCELHEVDLVAGHEALERSLWTRQWRRAHVATPLTIPAPVATVEPDATAPNLCTVERWRWARARAAALIDNGHGDLVAQRWPHNVATLREHVHTDADIDAIARVLDLVESRVRAPFPDDDQIDPGDGADMSPDDVAALRAAITNITGPGKDRFVAVLGEARDAGRPLSLQPPACERHWLIARALMVAARDHDLDDELARHTLAYATGDQAVTQLAVPLGAAVAALTIPQASRWADVLTAIHDGRAVLTWTPDGHPTVEPNTNYINNESSAA